jgi:hypothetical protein
VQKDEVNFPPWKFSLALKEEVVNPLFQIESRFSQNTKNVLDDSKHTAISAS